MLCHTFLKTSCRFFIMLRQTWSNTLCRKVIMLGRSLLGNDLIGNHVTGKCQDFHIMPSGRYWSLTGVEEECVKRFSIISGTRLSHFWWFAGFWGVQFHSDKNQVGNWGYTRWEHGERSNKFNRDFGIFGNFCKTWVCLIRDCIFGLFKPIVNAS